MAGKREKPEDIVSKLRQVEVLQGQGMTIADAVRQIGVTQQTVRRHMKWIRFRFELFDILAHRFFQFKLRLCDAASAAAQSSVV